MENPQERGNRGEATPEAVRSGSETQPEPYRDSREHLLDELRRLDSLLRVRVAEWRAENGGSADDFAGFYVADEEVDRLLRPSYGGESGTTTNEIRTLADRELLGHIEELTERLRGRERATLDRGTELRLLELTERFDLERRHLDVLLLALAPELDGKYETVYAYLHDDVTRKRPTVDLVLRALYRSAAERLTARRLFSWHSPLRRNRLLRLAGEGEVALPSRAVTVDERVVDFLLGEDTADTDLAPFVAVTEPTRGLDGLAAAEESMAKLRTLVQRGQNGYGANEKPLMVSVHGPYGSGKKAAVAALCAEFDTPFVKADAETLVADTTATVALLTREARLRGSSLYVENLDALSDGAEAELGTLLGKLDEFDGHVFLSGEQPIDVRRQVRMRGHEFAAIHFPIPSYERRRALWEDIDSLPAGVDTADLAAKFRLTGGQIADAVTTAKTLTNGEELSAETVYAGCRAQSRETLGSLGRKVEPNYTWDDIVLPADELAHLREVAAHINHHGQVYAEWGFEAKFSLGNGLNALFTGPSGTGKTMAAEIIAGDAGLDLYKIDLSNVVSKYIGETEKNLSEVFDEAENSNVILFFDEADALFGKRSEVKDAHDRYANIEVNYLLQRVEEHDGTVILTTNFKRNIDDAFLRRIHLSVDFPLPDEESREAIWRRIFPEETPCEGLDVAFLAGFELTGGNIKNIALTAAFLAADGGGTVEMEHVVRATKREFQKTGKLIRPEEFGKYHEMIEQ